MFKKKISLIIIIINIIESEICVSQSEKLYNMHMFVFSCFVHCQ